MTTTRGGFTLIEMIIAVALMGLFAVLVGPPMLEWIGRGKETSTESNLQAIKQAIDVYNMDTGYYPQTLNDLIRRPLDEESAENWRGPYLELKGKKEIPKDGWNRKFVYRLNEEGAQTPYELYSYGSKGKGAPKSEWMFA
jgi:general secretion pathway protein G